MPIFVDESGGTKGNETVFVVAAVSGPPGKAKKYVRSEMKGLKNDPTIRQPLNELKGNALSRVTEFDLLSRLPRDFVVSIVHLDRRHLGHAWALGNFDEHDLYVRMIQQAVRDIKMRDNIGVDVGPLVVDHGRYKKSVQKSIQSQLEKLSNKKTQVIFRESESEPGIQIADLHANVAYRRLSDDSKTSKHPTEKLFTIIDKRNGLQSKFLDLSGIAPSWAQYKSGSS